MNHYVARVRVLAMALACGLGGLFSIACSSNDTHGSARVCAPGTQVKCTCAAGLEAVQVCNDSGSGYLECQCPSGTGGGGGGTGGSSQGTGGGATGGTQPSSGGAPSGSGGSATGGTTGTGGRPIGSGGNVSGGASATGGAAGAGTGPFKWDFASCTPDATSNDCETCVTPKCCTEWNACGGTDCATGSPAGEGEISCLQGCVNTAANQGTCSDSALGACSANCASGTGILAPETQDLYVCMHDKCLKQCFGC